MSTLVQNAADQTGEMEQAIHPLFSIIPGMDKPSAVPVVDAATLTKDVFINEWVSRNRPCLVKGAVKHWPAMEKWRNKEYWITKCENYQATVYPHQNFINRERQNTGIEKISFHQAIEKLFEDKDNTFSMPGEQIVKGSLFAILEEDLPGFTFLSSPGMPRWYERMRFFAYRRAGTNWHYHGVDETLMCQVKGSKKVGLLSPGIPGIRHVTKFLNDESYLDGKTLDKSVSLNPYVADVGEGDALYIPPYWHHGVIPNDAEAGFTVAFCWRSPMHILGDFSNYLLRQVYGKGMWPLNLKTLFLPFLGGYAGLLYYTKKATGKI